MSYVVSDFYKRPAVYGPRGESRLMPGWGIQPSAAGPAMIGVGAFGDQYTDAATQAAAATGNQQVSDLVAAGISCAALDVGGCIVNGAKALWDAITGATSSPPPPDYVSQAAPLPTVTYPKSPTAACQTLPLLKAVYDRAFANAQGLQSAADQQKANALVDAINTAYSTQYAACSAAHGAAPAGSAGIPTGFAACLLQPVFANLLAQAQVSATTQDNWQDQYKINDTYDFILVNSTPLMAACVPPTISAATAGGMLAALHQKQTVSPSTRLVGGKPQSMVRQSLTVDQAPSGTSSVPGWVLPVVGLAVLAGGFYYFNK